MNEESLFLAALEKPTASERRAFLEIACKDDVALRERVEQLLAAHLRTAGILDQPARPPGWAEVTAGFGPGIVPTSERLGAIVAGRYKLIEEIGEGGMGTVWKAEQTQPVRRIVALKLIKPGMDSQTVLARFEAERQALALMDHPNIAKVLDGGTTQSGRPFFVMEYVKGVPFTQYCDDASLSVAQRLELFLPVCQAVQHAHTKGVIHRDLKPNNILVCQYDGHPVPKVIDFGLAKAIEQPLTEYTLHTAHGALLGTPLYMSPEQAELNNLDVDARTDVYALGVILYELLTGTTPLERQRFQAAAWQEMLRLIKEEEPPRPSARLSSSDLLPSVAAQRQVDPIRLTKMIRGELDWIVMKCLEKERARRYETADGLARDVERYLADESVEACPPSATYRLGKFIRRNRGPLLLAGALITALLVVVGSVLAIRAEASRNRAARTARATAIALAVASTAQERVGEAWRFTEDPVRMRESTDAAIASLRRADESLTGETLSHDARVSLTAARQDVADLARHARLLVAGMDNLWQFADDLDGQNVQQSQADFCTRQRVAFAQFGFDAVAQPADAAARTVAASRLRDPLLGMLLEWRHHAADPRTKDRLGQVIAAARRLSGGAYSRWQDLLDRKDIAGLVAFASSPDGLSFPPSLVGALGRDLIETRRRKAYLTYLRDATDRYPKDAWLHYELFYRTYRGSDPSEPQEALRHISAACVLRPESALFQIRLSECYTTLRAYDLAAAAARKSLALRPESGMAYMYLGRALAKKRDEKGAIAAYQEALRLRPNDPLAIRSFATGLTYLGRPSEAVRKLIDALGRFPAWADDPRLYVRYDAACYAMHCADGKGSAPVSPALRPTFRKQALDLLTAELAVLTKLAVSDREFVHASLQHWLADPDLESVRPPKIAGLPADDSKDWQAFWAKVKSLSDSTTSSDGSESP